MTYMGDRTYWEEKFSSRGETPLAAEGAVIEHAAKFVGESVLDIACGDGRNTCFLLERGFKVMGIDFSQAALDRLRRFAVPYEAQLQTRRIDLTQPDALRDIGMFDNAIICHYRLSQTQLSMLKTCISKEGIVLITGFGANHPYDSKIRQSDLIQKSDMTQMLEAFDLIGEMETKDERGCLVTYVLKKSV